MENKTKRNCHGYPIIPKEVLVPNTCIFCNQFEEDDIHLFIECPVNNLQQQFPREISQRINSLLYENRDMDKILQMIMGNLENWKRASKLNLEEDGQREKWTI